MGKKKRRKSQKKTPTKNNIHAILLLFLTFHFEHSAFFDLFFVSVWHTGSLPIQPYSRTSTHPQSALNHKWMHAHTCRSRVSGMWPNGLTFAQKEVVTLASGLAESLLFISAHVHAKKMAISHWWNCIP